MEGGGEGRTGRRSSGETVRGGAQREVREGERRENEGQRSSTRGRGRSNKRALCQERKDGGRCGKEQEGVVTAKKKKKKKCNISVGLPAGNGVSLPFSDSLDRLHGKILAEKVEPRQLSTDGRHPCLLRPTPAPPSTSMSRAPVTCVGALQDPGGRTTG